MASFIHGGPVNGVCFSPDGRTLATAAADCRVRLWDLATNPSSRRPKQLRHPGKVILLDASFSSDGKRLATAATDNIARIWSWDEDGKVEKSLVGHSGWIMCAVFHPGDPHLLATSSMDATARVWNIHADTHVELAGHEGPVWGIAFSPEGHCLATGSNDGRVRRWDLRERNGGPVASLSSWIAAGCQDGSIQICNREGKEVMQLVGPHEGQILSMSFSRDGSHLASCSSEGRICIWDLEAQRPVRF